jgi:hypothetical protein
MVRLDAYTYACSIYEELRLLFIELGITADITNYLNTSRTTYETAINNLTPTNISKGVLLYPLGDYNYKSTQINAIFINYLNALDISKQKVDYNINGVRQNIYFQFNILAKNYKDAEYLANLIHGKFYRHSGHKVFDLATNQFTTEYLYSVSDFGVEANKVGKADLEHIVEYIIAIGLNQVPILFNHTEDEVEYGIFQKLNTVLKIENTNYIVKTDYNYAIGTIIPCNAQSLNQIFQKIPVGVSLLIEDAPIVWLQLSLFNTYKANTFIFAGTVGTCAYAGDKDDYALVSTISLANKALTTRFTAKMLNRFTDITSIILNNNSISIFEQATLPKLATLNLANNPVSTLSLTGYPALANLDISNTSIVELNATTCPLLTTLTITNAGSLLLLNIAGTKVSTINLVGNLESANFSNCTFLTSITLTDNNLDYLNITGATNLINLYLSNNNLSVIEAANHPNLITADISFNALETATFSHCVNLSSLTINANNLDYLNLTNCYNLVTVYARNNNLENLSFLNFTNLVTLDLNYNNLTGLDIEGCTNLEVLNLFGNNLEIVRLDTCTSLESVRLGNNQLTTLDFTNCTLLKEIRIQGNLLTADIIGELLIDRAFKELSNGYFEAEIYGGGTLSNAALEAQNKLVADLNWVVEIN